MSVRACVGHKKCCQQASCCDLFVIQLNYFFSPPTPTPTGTSRPRPPCLFPTNGTYTVLVRTACGVPHAQYNIICAVASYRCCCAGVAHGKQFAFYNTGEPNQNRFRTVNSKHNKLQHIPHPLPMPLPSCPSAIHTTIEEKAGFPCSIFI